MAHYREWLSVGAEILLDRCRNEGIPHLDAVVVGSGYGGAVAALRLCEKGYAVTLLERGQEYPPGTFPTSWSDLPGHVRINRFDSPEVIGRPEGLYDVRVGPEVSALVGNGLGGGSLINAGVVERPAPEVFSSSRWPQALRKQGELDVYFDRARTMLGAVASPGIYAKFAAFSGFVRAVSGSQAQQASIAVHFGAAQTNRHGVRQSPCNGCGDCVTGCNFAAKNTLATNYLPAAYAAGAKFYTGVTVSHLEPDPDANNWLISFRPTIQPTPTDSGKPFQIRANLVVLAAGSFGTTEILMRSRARGLVLSERLGEGFSCNGDMIFALHDGPAYANACADESEPFAMRMVGPTITGIARVATLQPDSAHGSSSSQITIEELSVPAPLRGVFEEVVTTRAWAEKLQTFDWSIHRAGSGQDPLAVDPDAMSRTQLFAAMGDDGAAGALHMNEGWERDRDAATANGSIHVVWKDAGRASVYSRAYELVRRYQLGTVLPNPAWKPLPDKLAGSLTRADQSGLVFSVHPLGGCRMADRAEEGVADDSGRVFRRREGKAVYDTLLVVDGSIVPTALSINPLMTITALAERSMERVPARGQQPINQQARQIPIWALPAVAVPAAHATALRFSELMTGTLKYEGEPQQVQVSARAVFAAEGGNGRSIARWIRDSGRTLTVRDGLLRIPTQGMRPRQVKFTGVVDILHREGSWPITRIVRALYVYLTTRFVHDVKSGGSSQPFLATVLAAIRLASRVGEVRVIRYNLQLVHDLPREKGLLPKGTRIIGTKRFSYSKDQNPWRQLTELEVRFETPDGKLTQLATLKVDPQFFLTRHALQLQVKRQRDFPSAVADALSLGLFLTRLVAQVQIWRFRLPEYQKHDPALILRRLPQPLPGLRFERHEVTVTTRAGRRLRLPLARYRVAASAQPVLLIHGLGSGGVQFSSPRLQTNLVQHLAYIGFDVWVAELRTSIGVEYSHEQWTLDEVALNDIPAMFSHVANVTGYLSIDVVAHCIGSAMFCMAALGGKLPAQRVRRAVLLQVGPLIRLAAGTKLRGYAARLLRKYVRVAKVDFSVDDSAKFLETLVDRLLAAYPYPADSADDRAHRLGIFGPPQTHVANCNRAAAIDGRMFEHDNVSEEMLEALAEVLGHSNLTTWEQTMHYAFLERVTDQDGRNAYVTAENIRRRFAFPVCFAYGDRNQVFDPQTSLRSVGLLHDVFGSSHPAQAVSLPGYGHLDPLIGKNSWRDVYPVISKFLQGSALEDPQPGPIRTRYFRRLLLGPIVGWVRREQRVACMRIWCCIDDSRSTARSLVVLPLHADGRPNAHALQRVPVTEGGLSSIACFDFVPLLGPPGNDRQKLILVSEHYEGAIAPIGAHMSLQERQQLAIEVLEERRRWYQLNGEPGARSARATWSPGYDQKMDDLVVTRRTLKSADVSDSACFAICSCRYPPTLIDREKADEAFGGLRALLERRLDLAEVADTIPELLLLVGDQIYADSSAGLFDPTSRLERFYEAYREAWSAPNARIVFSRLPTYMMLDDHEVSDNWHPEDRRDPQADLLVNEGLLICDKYQLAHGPQNAEELCESAGTPVPLRARFYSFSGSGFPFFVCDTRTARQQRNSILGAAQERALENWLVTQQKEHKRRPKFVVSPSIVVPYLHATGLPVADPGLTRSATRGAAAYSARSDGWDGFPEALRRLFQCITDNGIENVVFLCGDAHLSMACSIELPRRLRAACIVSSPMYAPYPFANPLAADYVLDGQSRPLSLCDGAIMSYSTVPGSVCSGAGFTVVSAEERNGQWTIIAKRFFVDESRPLVQPGASRPTQAFPDPDGSAWDVVASSIVLS